MLQNILLSCYLALAVLHLNSHLEVLIFNEESRQVCDKGCVDGLVYPAPEIEVRLVNGWVG